VAINQQFGDHIHPSAIIEGRIQRTIGFDYDEVDRNLGFEPKEEMLTWADASAAISLILSWATGRGDTSHHKEASIATTGARIHGLLYWLDPANARYGSLQEIADAAGLTRAAVSKALVNLREELGGILPMKRSGSSDVYSRAQKAAIKVGVHSSASRKDLKSRKQVVLSRK
jgi:hypothetical protein